MEFQIEIASPNPSGFFLRLPFGLCNAPASFQSTMNIALKDTLYKHAMVYLDDIIIYFQTIEEHLIHLDHVITLIAKASLKIKPDKTSDT